MENHKNEVAVKGQQNQNRQKNYEHSTKYYETDQTGFIHQTNYVKWLEDARMDLLNQMGLGYEQMERMQILCPLLTETINYNGLIRFDETIVIETKVLHYDGSKMTLEYTLRDKESNEIRATAKSTHCFINRSGIPISLNRIYPELETRFFEFH